MYKELKWCYETKLQKKKQLMNRSNSDKISR